MTFTEIFPGVRLYRPHKHEDHRGFFAETFDDQEFGAFEVEGHSYSTHVGTVRGLHFQVGEFAQSKLVRVLHGGIIDVALDLRSGSLTFGKHVRRQLTAETLEQILVPTGFAHGFVTLEPKTEVLYKLSRRDAKNHARGILWCDSALGIEWGVQQEHAIVSERDRAWPTLAAYMQSATA